MPILTTLLTISAHLTHATIEEKALEFAKSIVGKKAEELSGKTVKALWGNIKEYKDRWQYKADDELLAVVNNAYWDATALLIHDFEDQYTLSSEGKKALEMVKNWIEKEKKSKTQNSSGDLLGHQLATLFASNSTSSQYLGSLDHLLLEDLKINIIRIGGEGKFPGLINMLEHGWQRGEDQLSWLQVVIFKFATAIRKDDKLSRHLSERVLSNLSVDIQALKFDVAQLIENFKTIREIEHILGHIQRSHTALSDKIDILLANQALMAKTIFGNSPDAILLIEKVSRLKSSTQYKFTKYSKRQKELENMPEDEDRKELLEVAKAAWVKETKELAASELQLNEIKDFVVSTYQFFVKLENSEVSENIKLAKELFEKGKFKEVVQLLSAADRNARKQSIDAKEQGLKNDKMIFAKEGLLLAQAVQLQFDDPDRFRLAVQYFEESIAAVPFFDNYHEYGNYLYRQNRKGEAIKLFYKAIETGGENMPETILRVYNQLGLLHNDRSEFESARECFEQAIDLYYMILKRQGTIDVTETVNLLNNLGGYYATVKNMQGSMNYFQQALNIVGKWSDEKLKHLLPQRALTYKNVGIFYKLFNDLSTAIVYLENAKADFHEVIKTDPDRYEPPYTECLHNLAEAYRVSNEPELAQINIKESVVITRRLYAEDPAYKPDLAADLQELGILIVETNPDEAKIYFDEALILLSELSGNGEIAYRISLATTFNYLAIYHEVKGLFKDALITYSKALTIYKELYDIDFKAYGNLVAGALHNIGLCYYFSGLDVREAIINLEASIQINRNLFRLTPQSVAPHLYNSLKRLADILAPIDKNAAVQLVQEADAISNMYHR